MDKLTKMFDHKDTISQGKTVRPPEMELKDDPSEEIPTVDSPEVEVVYPSEDLPPVSPEPTPLSNDQLETDTTDEATKPKDEKTPLNFQDVLKEFWYAFLIVAAIGFLIGKSK